MFRSKREDRSEPRTPLLRWRRLKSSADANSSSGDAAAQVSDDEAAASNASNVPPESLRSEPLSDESVKSRPNPRQRFLNVFHPDARAEENLKSMKRRVVQVRRQPDSAPVRFQMGFRSRTGWEPIRATRENQDCLVALVPWGPGSSYNLFAALDGHGRWGHTCAIFIAQRVVNYLAKVLKMDSNRQFIVDSLYRAVMYAERKLECSRANGGATGSNVNATPNGQPTNGSASMITNVDFRLSGSTGVFVLVHNSTLYCANVGDSRAIVGREEVKVREARDAIEPRRGNKKGRRQGLSKYKAVPVSIDQKPSRPDEKERLLAAGARVDAWEGVDVGEERVWLPEARTPGLAMSRTFGDLLVKEYGVHCEPEIYCLELCEDDRFVVMASDGVFEFVSNEEVAKMVGKWRDTGSAQEAAQELVKVSVDRWIEDDGVIDDVSCVVVFMNVVAAEVNGPCEPKLLETSVGIAGGDGSIAGSGSGEDAEGSRGLRVGIGKTVGLVDSELGVNGSSSSGGGRGGGGGGAVEVL